MFSFFRKDKGGPKPVIPVADNPAAPHAPRAGRGPAAETRTGAPTTQERNTALSGDSGFLVQEIDFQLAPEVEEAVMLYADGRTGEATAALNRYLLNNPDSRDPQPWRMLFDIHEATGQRQPFEDLSMDYAVRFELSPPAWRPGQAAPSTAKATEHPTFAFGANLSPQDKAGLDHFLRECETAETVVLDFSKTPVPGSDAYARAILDCMSRLATAGKSIHLIGGETFAVRLNASRADDRLSETLWLLLLMLLQLQGKAEAFEAAAVEFAIRFEISPPSYTPPRHVAVEPEAEAEDSAGPSGQIFPMRGVIGPGSAAVFDALREFAAPLSSVVIDLSQVSRIDFTVVGLLMDVVMKLVMAGKIVVFRDGNEMVCVLLHMVGVGQLASIQPKERK
jgi:anti-anti-sigma regulatory factor